MKAHAHNVAALEKLLGLCNTHSASYTPGNASIERTALTALLEEAQKSIQAVHKAEGDLAKAVNLRLRSYDDLPLLGTRIISIAEANGMARDHLADLNRIRKRFRSQPFSEGVIREKGTALNTSPGGQAGQTASDISGSSPDAPVKKRRQLNFESKADNFAAMIEFLENETTYAPKESQFTIEGLKAKLAALHAQNTAVHDAVTALQQARAARNEIVLNKAQSVVSSGRQVKRYFRGILGTTHEQFKPIRRIKFIAR